MKSKYHTIPNNQLKNINNLLQTSMYTSQLIKWLK